MFGLGRKKPPKPSAIQEMIAKAISGSRRERDAAFAALRAADPTAVMAQLGAGFGNRAGAWYVAVDFVGIDRLRLLEPYVTHRDAQGRRELAAALGETRSAATTSLLLLLLADVDPYVRTDAARAFEKTKDPAAIPALKRALRDPHCGVAVESIDALNAIAPASVTDLLCDVLADTSFDTAIRCHAAKTLNDNHRTARVIEALEQAATDSSEEVRKAACAALGVSIAAPFFTDLPRAIDIRRRDWVGLPTHVNPATCSESAFIPVPPGTYGLVRVEYVQGQPWLILAQGSFQYQINGGDFRVYWPNV